MEENKQPKKAKKKALVIDTSLPQGVQASFSNGILAIKKGKAEVTKKLHDPRISITATQDKITVTAAKTSKKTKKMICTFAAHIKNMLQGVDTGHHYILKVCSGHFPMTVAVEKGNIVVKNFFGEKTPRILRIKEGVSVKVEGEKVYVDGTHKDVVSQVAADIEQLTRRTSFDTRIFQDGCYIIMKDGKDIK